MGFPNKEVQLPLRHVISYPTWPHIKHTASVRWSLVVVTLLPPYIDRHNTDEYLCLHPNFANSKRIHIANKCSLDPPFVDCISNLSVGVVGLMEELNNFVDRPNTVEIGPHQPVKLNQVLQFIVNLLDGRDFISHGPSKPTPYINSFGMND